MNKYSGSNFDDFLAEEGILKEVSEGAQKRLIALQIEDAIVNATNQTAEGLKNINPMRSPRRLGNLRHGSTCYKVK